jgi:Ca-activated chloride channel family protein
MTFHYPMVLFLLVVPALLLAWRWTRRGRELIVPFDHGDGGSGRILRGLLGFAEMLPTLLLSLVVVILAGPQQLSEPKTKRVLSNIELCVDVSGSMTASFGAGNRYDASMVAIDEFLDYRKGDAFGLTFFGNEVLHWVPLTTDISAIKCSAPFMNPTNPGRPRWMGGTAIGKALKACRKQLLQREEGDRMIVLISDGASSDLRGGADVELARQFNDDRIIVYGIHIGGGEAPAPVVNITTLTGGEVFAPGDPESLGRVFQAIDDMAETRMEKTQAETMDDYVPASFAGLAILGLCLLCLFGLRFTPW